MEKKIYEAPEMDVIDLKYQSILCGSTEGDDIEPDDMGGGEGFDGGFD